jgi:DNA-binding protein YbaB
MSSPLSGGVDPSARLDQWVAAARAKAERYQAMQAQVGHVSVTESSQDGLVTVTVDSAGNMTDLRITDDARDKSGTQIASAVLLTLRRAQARLPEKLAEVMAETIGDDQRTVNAIVGNYRAKFPEPEPEPGEKPGSDERRRIGDIEAGGEPPRREQAAQQRSHAEDNDEDWGDQSVLQRNR